MPGVSTAFLTADPRLPGTPLPDHLRISVGTEDDAPVPVKDDFYFFLHGEDGKRCVVPNTYSVELLPRLQRLSGFDNEALVEGALGDDGDPQVIWEGRAGQARICGEEGR